MKTKIDKTKYLKFLNKYKSIVGLSDWKISISDDLAKRPSSLSEIESDIYEQELTIFFGIDFFRKSIERQHNIIIHELIHARVNIFKQKTELLINQEEEFMVNDITRGFEMVGKLKIQRLK